MRFFSVHSQASVDVYEMRQFKLINTEWARAMTVDLLYIYKNRAMPKIYEILSQKKTVKNLLSNRSLFALFFSKIIAMKTARSNKILRMQSDWYCKNMNDLLFN